MGLIFARKEVSRTKRIMALAFVCAAVFGLSANSFADDVGARGRKILEERKDAVVTIMLVLKQQVSFPGMASQNSESKSEATGTVIDPTGLTIVSLSETDPSSLVEAMMGGQAGARGSHRRRHRLSVDRGMER